MTEQLGTLIREARTAAKMTQRELAEAIDGLSARSISEAERGLAELTDEQLTAIAEVTGSESLLHGVDKGESPASFAEATDAPASGEKDILELFNTADPAVKAAALSVLKGETSQSKGFLDNILPMVIETLGGDKNANPLTTIVGFLASEQGKAFLGTLQGVLGNVTGMFGGVGAIGDADQDGRRTSNSLLVFTFYYAVAIYILLLSFYFWQIRTDIKLGK